MKLSVIIPLYNKATFLPQFFENIISQGLSPDDYELILINDGSTDETAYLCNQFKLNHPTLNIRYIYQENSGVSSARNKGISLAVGKYLHFMDCDDLLYPNSYNFLVNNFVNDATDFIGFGLNWINVNDTLNIDINSQSPVFNTDSTLITGQECIDRAIWPSSSVLALYRTEFIKRNNILFPVGIPIGEDVWFNFDFFSCNPQCLLTRNVHYIYCVRKGSAMNMASSKEGEKWLNSYYYFLSHLLERSSGNPAIRNVIDHHLRNLMRRILTMNISQHTFACHAQKYVNSGLFPIQSKGFESHLYNYSINHIAFFSLTSSLLCIMRGFKTLYNSLLPPPHSRTSIIKSQTRYITIKESLLANHIG